jgi:hypothetical protein
MATGTGRRSAETAQASRVAVPLTFHLSARRIETISQSSTWIVPFCPIGSYHPSLFHIVALLPWKHAILYQFNKRHHLLTTSALAGPLSKCRDSAIPAALAGRGRFLQKSDAEKKKRKKRRPGWRGEADRTAARRPRTAARRAVFPQWE